MQVIWTTSTTIGKLHNLEKHARINTVAKPNFESLRTHTQHHYLMAKKMRNILFLNSSIYVCVPHNAHTQIEESNKHLLDKAHTT